VRIAHTCADCGFDLTRTPAPIDAVYGLPIVVCPGCRAAVVRREHPTMVWSRWLGRLAAAGVAIAVRVAVTLAVAGAVIGMSQVAWRLVRELAGMGTGWELDGLIVGTVVWVVASLIGGFWMGMMWQHWRPWQISLLWLAVLVGLPAAVLCAAFIDHLTVTSMYGQDPVREAWNRSLRSLPRGFWMVGIAWAISLSLLIPGRWAGANAARVRRRRAWRLARKRRKQAWTSKLLLRA
jgi:MFS family permease